MPPTFCNHIVAKLTKNHIKWVQQVSLLVCTYNPNSKFDGTQENSYSISHLLGIVTT